MKNALSGQFYVRSVITLHGDGPFRDPSLWQSIQKGSFSFFVCAAATILSTVFLPVGKGYAGYCTYPKQGTVHKNNSITFVDDHEGEISRAFDYYVPPRLAQPNPQDQPPLVFIFHGHGSSANDIFGDPGSANMAYPWCRMMKYSDQDDFIICAPDGWLSDDGLSAWNDCRKPSSKTPETNDILFTQKLITWFINQGYNIDQNRIYAAGFSNGAGMVIRLSAEMDDRIAAVASVCSLTPLLSYLTECTEPDDPVSMIIMNGTADPLVTYAPYTESLVTYCVNQNGITEGPSYTELPTDPADPEDPPLDLWADLYRYESSFSFEPTSVFHYAIHEGGHSEPSKMERYPPSYTEDWGIGAGPQCADFEVAEEAWNFFKMHVLRGERVYRPTHTSTVIGTGSGDINALWVDDGHSYLIDDAGGIAMLAATFAIPDPQPIDSLRFTIRYRNSIAAPHSVFLWSYTSGPSGGWVHIATHAYNTPGSTGTINQLVIGPLDQYVNARRHVTVALSSDSTSSHQLAITHMEIGVTLKDLGSYADSDADSDGTVDGSDLYAISKEYGKAFCTVRCSGDCNGDDAVDAGDVTIFAAEFGQNTV